MLNKRGKIHPAIIFLGVFVIVAVVAGLFGSFSSGAGVAPKADLSNSVKLGDAIDVPFFNFFSFIIGEVPQFLIDWTNPISASIIIIALFFILVFTFSDILSAFGSFSSEYISWSIGIALAVIAANLKAIMWIAVVGFSIASGLGVLAVVVGVGAPFVIFLVLHFFLFKNLAGWARGQKSAKQFNEGVQDLEQGIAGAKAFGEAIRKK